MSTTDQPQRLDDASSKLESRRVDLLSQLVDRIRREADGFNRQRDDKSSLRWYIGYNENLGAWDIGLSGSSEPKPLGTPLFISKLDAMKVLVVYAEKLMALAPAART